MAYPVRSKSKIGRGLLPPLPGAVAWTSSLLVDVGAATSEMMSGTRQKTLARLPSCSR